MPLARYCKEQVRETVKEKVVENGSQSKRSVNKLGKKALPEIRQNLLQERVNETYANPISRDSHERSSCSWFLFPNQCLIEGVLAISPNVGVRGYAWLVFALDKLVISSTWCHLPSKT